MSNKLLPQVKLPYQYTKGTLQDRQRKSGQLVNKLYKNIKGRFKNGEIELSKIQDCIDEILPSHVRVIVKNSECNADFDGYSDIGYSANSGKINITTIELPTENKKIKLKDLPALLHEFQHITDQLFNPKYLARNQDMANKNLLTNKYNNIYDEYIYNYEAATNKNEKSYILKQIEYKLKEFLKGMSITDKINYLQDSRYSLIMENNAYFTQQKYAKKLNKQHQKIKALDLKKLNKDYMFTEKINLLKKIAGNIISKERAKFKAKLKHNQKLRNVKKEDC